MSDSNCINIASFIFCFNIRNTKIDLNSFQLTTDRSKLIYSLNKNVFNNSSSISKKKLIAIVFETLEIVNMFLSTMINFYIYA